MRWERKLADPRRAALRIAGGVVSLLLLLPLAVTAQEKEEEPSYQISQRATVSQMLGATKVSLDYSRPLIRGRDDVFGGVVHWGELWTPGANEATVFETDREVKLNGNTVPAGRWSMWVIPSQVGPWEMVLDPADSLFHTQRPELTDEQVRFPLEISNDGPMTEALLFTFEDIAQDGATLRMRWGTLEIDMDVAVESIVPVYTVPQNVAAAYVGTWRVEPRMPDPETGAPPPPFTVTITHDDSGVLKFHVPEGAFGPPPPAAELKTTPDMTPQERERAEARHKLAEYEAGAFSYALVPRAEAIFIMGYTDDDGMLLEVANFFHEFELQNGKAVRLTLRGQNDNIFGTATRAN